MRKDEEKNEALHEEIKLKVDFNFITKQAGAELCQAHAKFV